MNLLISSFFLLYFSQNVLGQDIAYRDSVKSSFKQVKKGTKIIKEKDNESKTLYYYHKKSNQVVSIIFVSQTPKKTVYYHFLDSDLVIINIQLPYSVMQSSIGKSMYGFYYFKNGILRDKNELNFPSIDIEEYRTQGVELYNRAISYLRARRI